MTSDGICGPLSQALTRDNNVRVNSSISLFIYYHINSYEVLYELNRTELPLHFHRFFTQIRLISINSTRFILRILFDSPILEENRKELARES